MNTNRPHKKYYAAQWQHDQPMWYSIYDSKYPSGEYTYPICTIYIFRSLRDRDAFVARASEQHARTPIRADGDTLRAYIARFEPPTLHPQYTTQDGNIALP